jgi:hypothetical protein
LPAPVGLLLLRCALIKNSHKNWLFSRNWYVVFDFIFFEFLCPYSSLELGCFPYNPHHRNQAQMIKLMQMKVQRSTAKS